MHAPGPLPQVLRRPPGTLSEHPSPSSPTPAPFAALPHQLRGSSQCNFCARTDALLWPLALLVPAGFEQHGWGTARIRWCLAYGGPLRCNQFLGGECGALSWLHHFLAGCEGQRWIASAVSAQYYNVVHRAGLTVLAVHGMRLNCSSAFSLCALSVSFLVRPLLAALPLSPIHCGPVLWSCGVGAVG